MRPLHILTCVLFISVLSSACWAEKSWDSAPDKLVLKASDDFEKVKPGQEGVSLELFSKAKNAQLILTASGLSPAKDTAKPAVVSTSDFIKAFPVLSTDKKIKVHAGPVELKVSGTPAVLYEIESDEVKGYQTVYTYVGRGSKPYALILNYPSPRNPDMVKAMKQILASVKHK